MNPKNAGSVLFTSKLPSAPHFSGDHASGSFRDWWNVFRDSIDHFDRQHSSRQWSMVGLKLKGEPLKMWGLLRRSHKMTFPLAIESMIAHYDVHLRPLEKLDKMRELKMGTKLSAQEYCRKFLIFVDEHYKGAKEGLNAPVVREIFLGGLQPHIRNSLSHALGLGVQELMQQAVIIDRHMGNVDSTPQVSRRAAAQIAVESVGTGADRPSWVSNSQGNGPRPNWPRTGGGGNRPGGGNTYRPLSVFPPRKSPSLKSYGTG